MSSAAFVIGAIRVKLPLPTYWLTGRYRNLYIWFPPYLADDMVESYI